MNKAEILREFQEAQMETFHYIIPSELVDYCKSIIEKHNNKYLQVSFAYYLELIEREVDFSCYDAALLLNCFYDFGWEHFKNQGCTIEHAKWLAEQQMQAVDAWEQQMGPARKKFNKKLELIGQNPRQGGPGGGIITSPN